MIEGEAPDAEDIGRAALRSRADLLKFSASQIAALQRMLDEAEVDEDAPDFDIDRMIAEVRAQRRG